MDSVVIVLSVGFKVETLPDTLSVVSIFGHYDLKSQLLDKNSVLVTRQFMVNSRIFPSKNQTDLALFFKQIGHISAYFS